MLTDKNLFVNSLNQTWQFELNVNKILLNSLF